jgi:hypothetical protein
MKLTRVSIRVGLAAALAAGVAVAFVMVPRSAKASTVVTRMKAAMQGITSIHETFQYADGHSFESWVSRDGLRMNDSDGSVMIGTPGGHCDNYFPDGRDLPCTLGGPHLFDPAEQAQETLYYGLGNKGRVSKSKPFFMQGVPKDLQGLITRVGVDVDPGYSTFNGQASPKQRFVFDVNNNTHLPEAEDVFIWNGSAWELNFHIGYEYNVAVPASMFAPPARK